VADAFEIYLDNHGKPNPAGEGFPDPGSVKVVDFDKFIDFASGRMPVDGDRKPERARLAVTELVANRYLFLNGRLLWR
jgi:hypothetical protein